MFGRIKLTVVTRWGCPAYPTYPTYPCSVLTEALQSCPCAGLCSADEGWESLRCREFSTSANNELCWTHVHHRAHKCSCLNSPKLQKQCKQRKKHLLACTFVEPSQTCGYVCIFVNASLITTHVAYHLIGCGSSGIQLTESSMRSSGKQPFMILYVRMFVWFFVRNQSRRRSLKPCAETQESGRQFGCISRL